MISTELIFVFVMIILDLLFVVIGGYMMPFVGAVFSWVFGGFLLNSPYEANVIFSPYPQVLLIAVGVLCFFKAVLTMRGVFD